MLPIIPIIKSTIFIIVRVRAVLLAASPSACNPEAYNELAFDAYTMDIMPSMSPTHVVHAEIMVVIMAHGIQLVCGTGKGL